MFSSIQEAMIFLSEVESNFDLESDAQLKNYDKLYSYFKTFPEEVLPKEALKFIEIMEEDIDPMKL